MMTKPLYVVALGLVTLSLVGCGASGKTDTYKPKAQEKVTPVTIVPGKEAEIFPIKAGNTWVYESDAKQTTAQGSRNNKGEITFRVAQVADTPEGKLATIEVSSDGVISDRMKWRVGSSGIYQVSGSMRDSQNAPLQDIKFEPAVPIVPFPVKAGSNLKVTATGIRPGAGNGPFQAVVSVEGIQEVDTAMGRYSALSTTNTTSYKEKGITFKSTTSAFWSPKVGIVRYLQDIVATNAEGNQISSSSVLRLKSFSP